MYVKTRDTIFKTDKKQINYILFFPTILCTKINKKNRQKPTQKNFIN